MVVPTHNQKAEQGLEPARVGVINPELARWLIPVLILLLTAAAFFPALENGFVDWDDDVELVKNPNYRGLGWAQLRWMFTTFLLGHYQPLTWISLGLDHLLWGMNPFGYHLTSFLLHAINALLLYFLALRLLSLAVSSPAVSGELALRVGAGFAALLFAVHPLRVESVAWATERRDVLSGLFFLLTILCYLRGATAESGAGHLKWTAVAAVLYGLSLLSKAVGMTLPLVLLALDVYPLRRLSGAAGRWFGPEVRKIWWEKIPFLILAIGAGATALVAQHNAGALKSVEDYGFAPRVAQLFFGIAFYMWKTVIPLGLSPLYELPVRFVPCDWPFFMSAVFAVVVTNLLFLARRHWPAALASWACYLIILAPVLGIAQSGVQLAADRYTYLPSLGWAVLAGAGLFYCWRSWINGWMSRPTFLLAQGLAGALLLFLGVLTWRQAQVWHDSESLWRQALSVDPQSRNAHIMLAVALGRQGKTKEAHELYRQAIAKNLVAGAARTNLGDDAIAGLAAPKDRIQELRHTVEMFPLDADAQYDLGKILAAEGQYEDAIQRFRQALRIRPEFAEAHDRLSRVLQDEALKHHDEALRIRGSRSENRPQS